MEDDEMRCIEDTNPAHIFRTEAGTPYDGPMPYILSGNMDVLRPAALMGLLPPTMVNTGCMAVIQHVG
ncbi:hypothetical protein JS530_04455 [Bifidobacterium sp. LC6]|uniref:Uncharacterized protein n=1 Tax=Bifidobacterium colobi TaxID=2809026 RepID=A0ABS5UUP8_9BIFI|nr:hypothetical protein [Bifidobacterium colobi]MBT1174762.1 hypothetical protein [Bifidobacterium colobi]